VARRARRAYEAFSSETSSGGTPSRRLVLGYDTAAGHSFASVTGRATLRRRRTTGTIASGSLATIRLERLMLWRSSIPDAEQRRDREAGCNDRIVAVALGSNGSAAVG